MLSPPSFLQDWRRHGLGAAWKKRFSAMSLGGRPMSYAVLLRLPWGQLQWCLNQAIVENKWLEACFAFEAMSIQTGGNDDGCWRCVAWVLSNHPEERGAKATEYLLRYVSDFESFKNANYGFWCDYLLGVAHLKRAQKAKGYDKTKMKAEKALSMHYLGRAREVIAAASQHQAPSPPGYQLAAFAAVLPLVAKAYEEAFYLVYKGVKTTAMVE